MKMVRPEGLEPPPFWFVAKRSIHLSYGRINRWLERTAFILRARFTGVNWMAAGKQGGSTVQGKNP